MTAPVGDQPTRTRFEVDDWGKAVLFGLLILGPLVLVGLGRISWTEASLVLLPASAYLMGNGRIARKGETPVPTVTTNTAATAPSPAVPSSDTEPAPLANDATTDASGGPVGGVPAGWLQ